MVRLQAEMGPRGIRRCQNTSRPVREHLASGHCPLQQVKYNQQQHSSSFLILFLIDQNCY